MTAAMQVLEPIFDADLLPEQYAYRPGRNAEQATTEVGELLFRGYRDVVDAISRPFLIAPAHSTVFCYWPEASFAEPNNARLRGSTTFNHRIHLVPARSS